MIKDENNLCYAAAFVGNKEPAVVTANNSCDTIDEAIYTHI